MSVVPECLKKYDIKETSAATFAAVSNYLEDTNPGEESCDATLFRAGHVISFLYLNEKPVINLYLQQAGDKLYKSFRDAETESISEALYEFADGFTRNELRAAYDYLNDEYLITGPKAEAEVKKD